jgi:hypothetical protein
VRHERARLVERHARALRVRLEIQREQRARIRPRRLQEVFGLRDAVAAGAEVIRAPVQASGQRLGAVPGVERILVAEPLRRLVDDAQDPVTGRGHEVDVAVVMREVDDRIDPRGSGPGAPRAGRGS